MKTKEQAEILKENFNNKKYINYGIKIFVYYSNIKKLYIPNSAKLVKKFKFFFLLFSSSKFLMGRKKN